MSRQREEQEDFEIYDEPIMHLNSADCVDLEGLQDYMRSLGASQKDLELAARTIRHTQRLSESAYKLAKVMKRLNPKSIAFDKIG